MDTNAGAVKHKSSSPFTRDVIIVIGILYATSAIILFTQIGPWEAVRQVGGNGLILVGWLWAAHRILGDDPIPELTPIRRPKFELVYVLLAMLITIALTANAYVDWVDLTRRALQIFMIGAVLALFLGLRYPLGELGLAWPSRRGWLALLAVILINFAAAALFILLPESEAETIPQADLSTQITGPWAVVVLIFGLLVRAALPEELLLRVALQPRLAHFIPLGWAILIQSLFFSAGHLPQQLIYYQEPFLIAMASLLLVNNGIIGGYLWWRTRSLPLLLILHLFAYARFGI